MWDLMTRVKLFILLLILFVCPVQAFQQQGAGEPQEAAPSCTETYSGPGGWTDDTSRGFGQTDGIDYYGAIYIPLGDETVCAIDLYIRAINGTLSSSHDYYIKICTLVDYGGGNYDCDAVIGTSDKVDGDGMSATTWQEFTFSSTVNLTSGVAYGIGALVDTDGNPNDDPGAEADGTNYPSFGDDNNANGDAITAGRWYYNYTSTDGFIADANDDPGFKVSTQ